MFLVFRQRNTESWVKVILFYLIISFVSDSILLALDDNKDKVAIFRILSAFTVLEYTLFGLVLFLIIDQKILRLVIIVCSLAFYVFAVISFLRATSYNFDSLTASIESIAIIIFCIFYLFNQLNKPQVIFIYQEPVFWFIVGFLVYCAGTLFLFIQASNLEKVLRDTYWNILYSLTVTKNILFAVAFSTKKSKTLFQSLENPFENDFLENPYKS